MAIINNFIYNQNQNRISFEIQNSLVGQNCTINDDIRSSINIISTTVNFEIFCFYKHDFNFRWANKAPEVYNLAIGLMINGNVYFCFFGERQMKTLTINNPLRLIVVTSRKPKYLIPISQSYTQVLLEAFCLNNGFYHELRGGRYLSRSQQIQNKANQSNYLSIVNGRNISQNYFTVRKRNNFVVIPFQNLFKAIVEIII